MPLAGQEAALPLGEGLHARLAVGEAASVRVRAGAGARGRAAAVDGRRIARPPLLLLYPAARISAATSRLRADRSSRSAGLLGPMRKTGGRLAGPMRAWSRSSE